MSGGDIDSFCSFELHNLASCTMMKDDVKQIENSRREIEMKNVIHKYLCI
jgi:hypothetical protein